MIVPRGSSSRLAREPERGRVGGHALERARKSLARQLGVGVVQAHHPLGVALVDPALLVGPAGERQLRGLAVLEQRLQVGAVLAQDRGGARAVDRRAVAGHDVVGLLDQRLEPRQRRQVRARRALGVQHRDLDRRQVVAAHQHARPRDPDGHAVLGVPVGGLQLELAGRRPRPSRAPAAAARPATTAAAGARRRCSSSNSRSSRWAAPGLVDQPRRGGLGAARAAPRGTRSGRAGGPSRRAWRAGRRR